MQRAATAAESSSGENGGPTGRGAFRHRLLAPTAALLGVGAAVLGPAFAGLAGTLFAGLLFLWNQPLGLGLLVASRSSLDYFQPLSLVPGPFALNPASALGIAVILLALAVIALKLRTGSRIDWGGGIGLLWFVWLVASAFALVVGLLGLGGTLAADGIKELVRLTSVLALYLLIVNLFPGTTSLGSRWLIWACYLGLLVPAAAGIYQLLTGSVVHQIYGVRRIAGTFGHPNAFGIYLTGLIFLGLGFFQDLRARFSQRILLLAAVAGAFLLLIFTYSRSSLGTLLGALLIWAWWGSARRRLVVLGGVAAAAVVLAPAIAWRFQDLFVEMNAGPVSGEDVSNSFAWRLLNYQRLLGSFLESPVVGHGLASIALINPTKTRTVEGFESGFASHNEVIRVLVEQGIVGLIVWVFVAFGTWRILGAWVREQLPAAAGGHPASGEAVRALFLALVLLSGVGMGFLNQTVLLYVIFTVFGVLRVGRREDAGARRAARLRTGDPASAPGNAPERS